MSNLSETGMVFWFVYVCGVSSLAAERWVSPLEPHTQFYQAATALIHAVFITFKIMSVCERAHSHQTKTGACYCKQSLKVNQSHTHTTKKSERTIHSPWRYPVFCVNTLLVSCFTGREGPEVLLSFPVFFFFFFFCCCCRSSSSLEE